MQILFYVTNCDEQLENFQKFNDMQIISKYAKKIFFEIASQI